MTNQKRRQLILNANGLVLIELRWVHLSKSTVEYYGNVLWKKLSATVVLSAPKKEHETMKRWFVFQSNPELDKNKTEGKIRQHNEPKQTRFDWIKTSIMLQVDCSSPHVKRNTHGHVQHYSFCYWSSTTTIWQMPLLLCLCSTLQEASDDLDSIEPHQFAFNPVILADRCKIGWVGAFTPIDAAENWFVEYMKDENLKNYFMLDLREECNRQLFAWKVEKACRRQIRRRHSLLGDIQWLTPHAITAYKRESSALYLRRWR